MDHLVLDIESDGSASAYFTIYSLGHMRDVGAGRVALLRIVTGGGVLDRCFSETPELGRRMQHRLRAIRADGGPAPEVGTTGPPIRASIRRLQGSDDEERWVVESPEHAVTVTWGAPEPPFWVSAPAGTFHPTRDYVTTMISYRQATLVVDDEQISGEPYDHAGWQQRLGKPFSSCHVALAETAIEAV
ncbi:MAG: hypothetical protein WD990_00510 [Acidimicrobiia bacterium]